MTSIYNSFANLIPGVPGAVLFWLLTIILFGVVVFAFRFNSQQVEPSTRGVSRAIKKLGVETVSDVMIHDDIEGAIHIEHLCLTPAGIAVVDIKDYRGYLFGGANTDQWTQVIDNRSYRFENPLHRNKDRVRAIEALVNDIPIFGRVVFTNAGTFPKDKPEGVIMQENLYSGLGMVSKQSEVPQLYQNEWEQLKRRLQPSSELIS